MGKRRINSQILLRFLCAMSLLLLAFGHQPVLLTQSSVKTGSDTASPEAIDGVIRDYTLPDGTVLSICLTRTGTPLSDHNDHIYQTACEACRISASIILPLPQESGGPVVRIIKTAKILETAPVLPRSTLYPPAAPPQAPPVV